MRVMQILPHMNVGGVERGVVDLAKFYKEKETGSDKDIKNIIRANIPMIFRFISRGTVSSIVGGCFLKMARSTTINIQPQK